MKLIRNRVSEYSQVPQNIFVTVSTAGSWVYVDEIVRTKRMPVFMTNYAVDSSPKPNTEMNKEQNDATKRD